MLVSHEGDDGPRAPSLPPFLIQKSVRVCVCAGCWGTDTCFYIKAHIGHMDRFCQQTALLLSDMAYSDCTLRLCRTILCVFDADFIWRDTWLW